MSKSTWTQRIDRPPGPRELGEVRGAARDLIDQGRHMPTAGPTIESVAKIAFVGTAVISMSLGLVHLWQALVKKPRVEHPAEPVDHHRHANAARKVHEHRHR
jgi:hypothetical protein